MGVDTRISLPNQVTIHDVANAIGVLFGCPSEEYPSHGHVFWRVPAVLLQSSSVIGCASIRVDTPTQGPRSFLYHFEGDGPEPFGRTLLPRATAVNIALCKRLVGIFGGVVDFNDSDSEDYDYFRPTPTYVGATGGDPWVALQDAIFQASPLTDGEVAVCEPFAAYKGVILRTKVSA